jgi:hypothetical protein
MNNKFKVILLCMLYVCGYQILTAAQINGEFGNKRVVISQISNKIPKPGVDQGTDRAITTPLMVSFAPLATTDGANNPPRIHDNLYFLTYCGAYSAMPGCYLRSAAPTDTAYVKLYLGTIPNNYKYTFSSASAKLILTITPHAIIYDEDNHIVVHVQQSHAPNDLLAINEPYTDISLELTAIPGSEPLAGGLSPQKGYSGYVTQ